MPMQFSPKTRNLIFSAITVLVIIADQLSKLWVRMNMFLGQSIPETGFFQITYTQNTGAVFGIFQGNNSIIIILVVLEVILILAYYMFIQVRFPVFNTRINTVATGLILAGAIGNLVDRIHLGYVTDFISIGPWPNFNLADSSGVIGVILFAISILLIQEKATPPNR